MRPLKFNFKHGDIFFQLDKYTSECDIIQASTQRHLARYFSSGLDTNTHIHLNGLNGIRFAGSLTEVELIMNNKGGCQKYPHKDMDEHCRQHYINIVHLSTSRYSGVHTWLFIHPGFSFSDEIKVNSPDDPAKAKIIAFSVWGILRGMESFGQLIHYESATNSPGEASGIVSCIMLEQKRNCIGYSFSFILQCILCQYSKKVSLCPRFVS